MTHRLIERAKAAGYRVGPSAGGLSWDWAGIRAREAKAREKAKKLDRCALCGFPLWGGQIEAHKVCLDATRKGL